MSKQILAAGVVICLWVLALSYCGSAHADKLSDRARELVGQDRRGALQQLLAQNPELKALNSAGSELKQWLTVRVGLPNQFS